MRAPCTVVRFVSTERTELGADYYWGEGGDTEVLPTHGPKRPKTKATAAARAERIVVIILGNETATAVQNQNHGQLALPFVIGIEVRGRGEMWRQRFI